MSISNELKLLEYLHQHNKLHGKKKLYKKNSKNGPEHDIDKHKLIPFQSFFHTQLESLSCQQSVMVIAHYSENLEWAKKYKKWVYLYHKGFGIEKNPILSHFNYRNISNVGREGHTYLYYIVKMWNNLPDNIFFTQGNCSSDHRPFPIETYLIPKKNIPLFMNVWNRGIDFIDYPGGQLKHIGKWKREKKEGQMSASLTSFQDWWYQYIASKLPMEDESSIEEIFNKWKWSHGAIFSVSKKTIQTHSLQFYQKLLTNLQRHVNPEEGHFLEKSWFYLFDYDEQKKLEPFYHH